MWCTLGFLQQSLRDKLQFFGGGDLLRLLEMALLRCCQMIVNEEQNEAVGFECVLSLKRSGGSVNLCIKSLCVGPEGMWRVSSCIYNTPYG